jgi:two-component system CheB/CheR fusion protein
MPVSRRVLVVDDNVDAVDSIAVLLSLSGHRVQTAHDGHAAVRIALSFRPEFIFMDLGMPGLDGFGAAQRLRREPGFDAVRIIAVTAYGTEDDRRRSREAGFDQHYLKPLDPRFLESLLGNVST